MLVLTDPEKGAKLVDTLGTALCLDKPGRMGVEASASSSCAA